VDGELEVVLAEVLVVVAAGYLDRIRIREIEDVVVDVVDDRALTGIDSLVTGDGEGVVDGDPVTRVDDRIVRVEVALLLEGTLVVVAVIAFGQDVGEDVGRAVILTGLALGAVVEPGIVREAVANRIGHAGRTVLVQAVD